MSETKDATKSERQAWLLKVLGISPPAAGEDPTEAVAGEDYREYLLRALRQLRQSGHANFAIVLGRKPGEHRMAFSRTRGPMALGSQLIRQTGLHLATWGLAEPHPDREASLLLILEGRALPALKKRGEQMLRFHRPLPMKWIVPLADGVEMQDAAEDEDLSDPTDEIDNDANSGIDDDGLPGLLEMLPGEPPPPTDRAQTLMAAAESGTALIEECPLPPPFSTRIED